MSLLAAASTPKITARSGAAGDRRPAGQHRDAAGRVEAEDDGLACILAAHRPGSETEPDPGACELVAPKRTRHIRTSPPRPRRRDLHAAVEDDDREVPARVVEVDEPSAHGENAALQPLNLAHLAAKRVPGLQPRGFDRGARRIGTAERRRRNAGEDRLLLRRP